jgi:hypothetical protein
MSVSLKKALALKNVMAFLFITTRTYRQVSVRDKDPLKNEVALCISVMDRFSFVKNS